MVCLYCANQTAVANSRLQKKSNHIWRRRKCLHCRAVFTTIEAPDLQTGLSVYHQNSYKPFYRDKLFISIYESLKHRKAALTDATALTDTVLLHLQPVINGTVDRDRIVSTVLGVLQRFDKVAATHYGAYHAL